MAYQAIEVKKVTPHVGAEIGRVNTCESAAALADRRAQCVDDVRFRTHRVTITELPCPNSPWLIVRPTFAPST